MQPASRSAAPAAGVALDTALSLLAFIRAQVRVRKPADVSMAQFRFLSLVAKAEHDSLSGFSDELGCSPAAASKLVDGLVDRNLLTRTQATDDRRRLNLALTTSGKRLLSHFRADLEQSLAERMARVPESELKQLVEHLRRLQTILVPEVIA